MPEDSIEHIDFNDLNSRAISQPLVKHINTADPSAHVFDGKIYIYPSHDIDTGDAFDLFFYHKRKGCSQGRTKVEFEGRPIGSF